MLKQGLLILGSVLILIFCAVVSVIVEAQTSGTTTRVSIAPGGVEANYDSLDASISADGQLIAFDSAADNLVPGDTNTAIDVFVYDRQTGQTTRVSVDSAGDQASDGAFCARISADGNFISFVSWGDDLVPNDTNHTGDIFVHNRLTGETTRVSVSSSGAEANNMSYCDIRTRNISADGRYIAFQSNADNLVPNDTNNYADIFVHDRLTGQTIIASISSTGRQGEDQGSIRPAISADGRYVAFVSWSSTLVPNDTNYAPDIFVRDLQTGTTTRVSVTSEGAESHPGTYDVISLSISGDGRYIVFDSTAADLIPGDINNARDIFVHDQQTHQIRLVSIAPDGTFANSHSSLPSVSFDGRYVTFESEATNLVTNDQNGWISDIFLRDLTTDQTYLISVASDGTQANAVSGAPDITSTANLIVFESFATNLLAGPDQNSAKDIFLRDWSSPGAPPIAAFSTDQTFGTIPLTVHFTDLSTGVITSYQWSFGDGGTSTEKNPTHIFVNPGTYTVTLTVNGPNGSANKTVSITVKCVSPTGLNVCALEPGDILLSSGSPDARTVFFMVGSYWFHGGMYDEDSNGRGYIIEAGIGGSPQDEVARRPIELTGFYNSAPDWVVLRLKPNISNRQTLIQNALIWARDKADDANVRYLPIIMSDPATYIHFFDPRNKFQEERFYCTLLVWHAYSQAGIDLDYPSAYVFTIRNPLTQSLQLQVLGDDLYASSIGAHLWPAATNVVQDPHPGALRTIIPLLSPADVRITDGNGQVVGIDPATGQTVSSIPGAFYSGPDSEPEWIAIPDLQGAGTIDVYGTGTGEYNLAFQVLNGNSIHTETFTGQTVPDQHDVYQVSTIPLAPALIEPAHAIRTNNNQPIFSWHEVDFGASYQIQIDNNSDLSSPEFDTTTSEPTYNIPTRLADGITYVWRVRAINPHGIAGDWSETWIVPIDTSRPAAPILINPADRSNTISIIPTFKWNKVSGATEYRLEVDNDPAFGSPFNIGAGAVTTTSYTIPTANTLPYGEYYWRVQAGNAANLWSDWSVVRRFTVTLLKSPANSTHLTDTTPTLSWTKPTGATAFEFKLDNSGGTVVGPFNTGLLTSYTPAVLPDGEYWWSVRVLVGGVWSEWMPAWTFTVTAPPTVKPALLSPTNGFIWPDLTPIFTWGTVTSGHHYQIQIDNDSNFSSPQQDAVLNPGIMTYTATPLPDGGKYYWRVRAINETGVAGAWSSTSNFTLTQLSAPTLTAPLNKAVMMDRTPDFAWSVVSGAASYQIQISTDANFVTITHQGSSATNAYTVPDMNALPDGVYTWRVRAVNTANIPGKWSSKFSFTVDNVGPATPVLSSPKPNSGTADTTPAFSWKAPKDGKTYRIQVTTENDPDFAAMVINDPASKTNFTPLAALDFGGYLWQVQALDALGNPGEFSPASLFDITLHKSPADGAPSTSAQPTFTWNALTGATSYTFELATDANFTKVIATYSGANKTFKPAALGQGTYYWHVKANTSGWMPAWMVIITPPLPAKPDLTAPANKALLNDSTPTLNWNTVTGVTKYQVQIDNNTDFSSPAQDVTVSGLLNYIASELPDGTYAWRVRAINAFEAAGAWSSTFALTIDTTPPAIPVILAPVDGTSMTNTKFNLAWSKVTDATRYEVQIDTVSTFPLPPSDVGNKTSYKPTTPLARGDYFWRVRAVDKAGNVSDWSPTRSFEIVAGVTSADSTPTPTLNIAPTDVPVGPTLAPTASLVPTVIPPDVPLYTLESDDLAMTQTGVWTVYDTPYASGGRYLYSSGSLADALTFTFSGTQLDVIYVQHPALGQFVVEIDGAPLLLADGYAAEAAFGVRQSILLNVGQHTARLYPLAGTIAIDAVIVQQTPIVPPVEPTVIPTTEPTLEPTVMPTVEPTLIPTSIPTPVLLPFGESFDSGSGWMASGAWLVDTQTAHSGAAWWVDSTQRGLVSTLTYTGLIDLRTAQYPLLGFWQRGVLSSAEVLSVEVSTDGGLMWWPALRQSGISTDWTWQTVDLSAYRGNIISLCFVLNTSEALPEGATAIGFGLDDLLIQDVPPIPTLVSTVEPTIVPPTLILTDIPTLEPTWVPTDIPTEDPTAEPTIEPTPVPTEVARGTT